MIIIIWNKQHLILFENQIIALNLFETEGV